MTELNLKLNLNKLNINNPLITASGTFGYGEEIRKYMEKDMLIDYLIKENTKLLNTLRKIKQMNIDFTHREEINEMIDEVVEDIKE